MNIGIIQNSKHLDFSSEYHFHKIIDLRNYREAKEIKKRHDDEIPHFEWILSEINGVANQLDVLIISNLLKDDSESFISDKLAYRFSAFELALHVRFHEEKSVRNLPIVVLSFKSIEQIIEQHYDLPQILGTHGFFLANPNLISSVAVKTWASPISDIIFEDDRFIDTKLKSISQLIGDCNKRTIEEDNSFDRKVNIVNTATSNHDISNEWGAYRMAEMAGLDMENFSYPKTLYFKYLLSNYDNVNKPNVSNYQPFFDKNLKILFIDDYCDKEWDNCLKNIFDKKIILEGKGESTFITNVQWNDSYIDEIKSYQYDLILLDYYLSNNEKGIDKLKLIKLANPAIPVIMFTASNKAWNMDELYEAGADGYYVKEHPESVHDAKFSIKNFESFHETVKNCLDKGKILGRYWKQIKYIEQNTIIEDKLGADGKLKFEKGRIDERLMMFLGLLKKAFEQTKFDKDTFFYSEWELAFITLWSLLNEIQEAVFIKSQPNLTLFDSNGAKYTHNTGRNRQLPITYLKWQYRWSYKGHIFIEYEYNLQKDELGEIFARNGLYQLNGKQKNSIKYDKKNQKYILLNRCEDTKVNLEDKLHMQIAFILLKMNANDILLSNLLNLNNKVRNKLYLTHGDDSASLNFAVKYKTKRKSAEYWKTHIEQLFEIVYFLCTGKECIWDSPK